MKAQVRYSLKVDPWGDSDSRTGEWMLSSSRFIAAALFSGLVFHGQPPCLSAQEPAQGPVIGSAGELPEAPSPQLAFAAAEPPGQQTAPGQEQNSQPVTPGSTPVQGPAAPGTAGEGSSNSQKSSSQTPTTQPNAPESQHQKAEEQIKEQEHQRVLGIIPAFNISYREDAVSLTPGEKFRLALRSAGDPYTFGIAFIVAGLGEAKDDDQRFGWGFKGYAKRSGAAYLDAADGTIIGNALLPIVLHQDPRYFRLGHGPIRHRFFYAVATSFICKHDNTGKWEPNYSNVGGNIVSGAISNLYYPASKSGIAQTIEAGMTVTFEGTFGATLQEFWPDISRKFFHKDPTHGIDSQARQDQSAQQPAQLPSI
jgi:hypothetical protein